MTCVTRLLALMKCLKNKFFCYLLQKIQKLKNLAAQINVRLIRNPLNRGPLHRGLAVLKNATSQLEKVKIFKCIVAT